MDTELRDADRGWHQLVTGMLKLLDDLGHQINLPDRLQDSLCQRLDSRVAGKPDRAA